MNYSIKLLVWQEFPNENISLEVPTITKSKKYSYHINLGTELVINQDDLDDDCFSEDINQDNIDDIRALQKKSEQGLWLLILELPIEIELPWEILKETNCLEIITIGKE